MSWRDVMDGMAAAIAAAARMPDSQVVWAYQDVDQPPDPYIRLAMPTILTVGMDFLSLTFDGTRPIGFEYKIQPQGQREIPLEVECFTDSTADELAANFVLEQAKTQLLLPSVRNKLTAVGVSLFDPGPVQYVPQVVAAGFRGRATCTMRCYAPAQALAEYCGYIVTVAGTLTTTGGGASTPPLPYTGKVG